MPGYRTEVEIASRALQLCRMNGIERFDNSNRNAVETGAAYDKLRLALLSEDIWLFSTRRAALRPVDTVAVVLATNGSTASGVDLPFGDTTGVIVGQLVAGTNIATGTTVVSFVENLSVTLSLAITGTVASAAAITFGPLTFLWIPPAWAVGTTYAVGHVTTYGGEWWQSKVAGNLANIPGQGAFWRRYVGVDCLQSWDTNVGYWAGELVLATDGTVYMALISSDTGHDPTATSGFWLAVNGTVVALQILYPIDAGPSGDASTRNLFRLPRGFLRKAPTDPKGDIGQSLGVPTGPVREDWVFEDNYLISGSRSPITSSPGVPTISFVPIFIRYVADVIDVPDFPPLFSEALAGKIADAVAPQLVAADVMQVILASAARHYKMARDQAILVDGIERGPTAPPLDSYITCRY